MTDIHYQQAGFLAMPETDGHGDTCGPDAMMAYLHVSSGMQLTIVNVDALRQELINRGYFSNGMTLGNIVDAMRAMFNVHAVAYTPWGQVNQATLRTDLIAACTKKQAVFLETSQASKLPGNQVNPWVNNHFIVNWGADSTAGYWTANGDTLIALGTTSPVPPVWYSWGNLSDASIQSYAIFPAVENSMPIVIETNPQGLVIGAHDGDIPSKKVGAGMALVIQQKNQTNLSIDKPETYYDQRSLAVLLAPHGGTPQTLTYSAQWNVEEYGGEDLATLVSGLMQPKSNVVETSPVEATPATDTTGALADIETFLGPLLDAVKKLGGS